MKTKIYYYTIAALLTSGIYTARAQEGRVPADSLRRMYEKIEKNAPDKNLPDFEKQLKLLLQSTDENDFITASGYYYQLKRQSAADSVRELTKKRFPKGMTMRSEALDTVYQEKDVFKMEALFKKWIAKYPPESFTGLRVPYDYARSNLAAAFVKADQGDKALYYVNQLETPFWRGEGYAGIANAFLRKGDTVRALPLLKRAIENAKPFLNPKPGDNQAMFAAMGYPDYCTTYSRLLAAKKQYSEALIYLEEADKHSKNKNEAFYLTYADLLKSTGKKQESLLQLETAAKEGFANKAIMDRLKAAYLESHGDSSGFAAYEAGLKRQLIANIKARVGKELIDEPAAAFSLKDLNGNLVSLADMKGKVVVLDFWATWCGPCVRSFPAMQRAVNLYKNDPNVRFLFIDTWENADNYEVLVKDFLAKNNYKFDVLFDPKDKDTKKSAAADSYNVKGIPAKFIIDGNGKIRFKLSGFAGGEEAAVQELSAMIELAKRGV